MREPLIPKESTDCQKIRLMLVDDSSIFLGRLSPYLQQVPEVEVVGTARGCEDAIGQAESLGAQIVILGLTMPGLPELAVIARLRAEFPRIGVIVLTLRDQAPYRRAALAAGAAEFVSRASAGRDLMPAIWRVAAARPSATPTFASPLSSTRTSIRM